MQVKLLHTKRADTKDMEDFKVAMFLGKRQPSADELANCYDTIWQGEVDDDLAPLDICEHLFHATNARQFSGGFHLPSIREFARAGSRVMYPAGYSHASTSVGDVIIINGQVYLCASVGWTHLEALSEPITVY